MVPLIRAQSVVHDDYLSCLHGMTKSEWASMVCQETGVEFIARPLPAPSGQSGTASLESAWVLNFDHLSLMISLERPSRKGNGLIRAGPFRAV